MRSSCDSSLAITVLPHPRRHVQSTGQDLSTPFNGDPDPEVIASSITQRAAGSKHFSHEISMNHVDGP